MKSNLACIADFLFVSLTLGFLGFLEWKSIALYGGIAFISMIIVLVLKDKYRRFNGGIRHSLQIPPR